MSPRKGEAPCRCPACQCSRVTPHESGVCYLCRADETRWKVEPAHNRRPRARDRGAEMTTDTTVRCDKCGTEKRVSFQGSLRSGWPKCHGYTMRMTTTRADIAKATTAALREQWPR